MVLGYHQKRVWLAPELPDTGKLVVPRVPLMIRYAAPSADFAKLPFKLQPGIFAHSQTWRILSAATGTS